MYLPTVLGRNIAGAWDSTKDPHLRVGILLVQRIQYLHFIPRSSNTAPTVYVIDVMWRDGAKLTCIGRYTNGTWSR